MNRGKSTWALLLLGASLSVSASGAPPNGAAGEATEAEPPEVVEARDTFRLGSFLAKQGQWVDALSAFGRSGRLRPHPITTYNIAYCERALGRYARAAVRFAEALPKGEGGAASDLPLDLVHEATQYLEEARLRVVRVRVTVSPADAVVRVDGRPLEPVLTTEGPPRFLVGEAEGESQTLPATPVELWLDPGAHVFVAAGSGEARVVESRTFAAGEHAELRLEVPSPPPPPAPEREPLAVVAPLMVPKVAPPPPDRLPAYIAFGVGGVGLVAGAVFASLSLAQKSSLDAEPACVRRQCPPSYADQQERMLLFADLATAGLVTGGVGAGLGTLLYFIAAPSPPPSASRSGVTVAPFLAGRGGGLGGTF